MKFFLTRLLLLLVVAYMSQLLVFNVTKGILDRKSKFRLTRFFRAPRHANFVIGNSRAVNSVDEKYAITELHKDIINLGFNGMPYRSIKTFLDEVNSNNSHATIFIEITGLISDVNDDSYSYYISNSRELKTQYKNGIFDIIPLLRLDNELFLRNIYYLKKSDNDWVNRYTISHALVDEIKSDTTTTIIFPDKKKLLERMQQLNSDCITHQNRAIFFLAPYYPDYLLKITDYKEVCELMKGKVWTFYDLNRQKIPVSAFADRVHTNVTGAAMLTRFLLAGDSTEAAH